MSFCLLLTHPGGSGKFTNSSWMDCEGTEARKTGVATPPTTSKFSSRLKIIRSHIWNTRSWRISIATQFAVSQPPAFATSGQTVVTPQQQIEAEETRKSAVAMPAASSVEDLVKALNAIGAPSRDLMSILQALKAVGSLDADLEVM